MQQKIFRFISLFRFLLCVFQIGVAFYEMLQAVDQHSQHLSYMDPICDFLYHIKYMYTGDSVKEQVRLSSIKLQQTATSSYSKITN